MCVEKSVDDSASVLRVSALHWLFEVQDTDVIANLVGSSDIQLSGLMSTVTPFDCSVLGYCVSHSNCTWEIDLSHCCIGDEGVELLV